ncbi:26s proteasome regulatory particle subunit [Echinococcus multilocularis]|uniref:26s proteasome regulatory particle subunit n=1 Tax=Echinococcus multilocularis TaxID=6211 RepID=A0A087W117_ECHMU|nr:26s proteasome regulatory particle subunit [Echinococcus multilocularis]
MKFNDKAHTQKTNRNYGKCDICEIVYASEMVSVQHMLSLKHHKRYEAVQRSLGNPISHFCPVCGIGGIRDIKEWTDHVCSILHSSNFGQYMQISNTQKMAGKRQRNDKLVHGRLLNEPHMGESFVSLAMSKTQPEIILQDQVSSSGSGISEDLGNLASTPTSEVVRLNLPSTTVEKAGTSLSREEVPHTNIGDRESNCYPRSTVNERESHHSTNDQYSNDGSPSPNYYRIPLLDYRRSRYYPASHSSDVYWDRSSQQRMNHFDCNRTYDYHHQSYLVRHPRPYRSGRSSMLQSHLCSPRSNSFVSNERPKISLESDRDNASRSDSWHTNQEEEPMVDTRISENELARQSPESPKSVPQNSMQQESAQQRLSVQEGPSTEYSVSVMTDPSARPTLSALPLSSTVEKTHEVWELSEALDKLRQQQHTLTHYIRQLKYIRQQKSEEKRLLRKRRSALLREMNLSDSQAETGSSDEFDDNTEDGLGPIETVVEGHNFGEVVVSASGATSNVVPSAPEIVDEARDRNRPYRQPPPSSVADVMLDNVTSSASVVTTVLPASGLSAEGGNEAFTSDEPELPMLPTRSRKHSSQSDQTPSVSAAAAVKAPPGQLPEKDSMVPRGGRRPRRKNPRNVVSARRSSRRKAAAKHQSQTPTPSNATKRRKVAQDPPAVEVISGTFQQTRDGKAIEAESESGVDPTRLRWVRQLLSHPQSRVYTFAELDKLVIDIVNSAAPSKSSKQVSNQF